MKKRVIEGIRSGTCLRAARDVQRVNISAKGICELSAVGLTPSILADNFPRLLENDGILDRREKLQHSWIKHSWGHICNFCGLRVVND